MARLFCWPTAAAAGAEEAARIGEILPTLANLAGRVAWLIAWRDRYRAIATSYARLTEAYEDAHRFASGRDAHRFASGRDEQWASSYHARRARCGRERAAAQARAYATALATLAPDYDAPDGAGENVEAYRG